MPFLIRAQATNAQDRILRGCRLKGTSAGRAVLRVYTAQRYTAVYAPDSRSPMGGPPPTHYI